MGSGKVLASFILTDILDEWQQIRGIYCIVLIYDFLHLFFPFYDYMLIGLFTPIGQDAVLDILFPQKCNINERHSTSIEAEHKNVPCQISRGT